jgi:hypothetical protein
LAFCSRADQPAFDREKRSEEIKKGFDAGFEKLFRE